MTDRVLTIDEVEDAYNAASMYAIKEWQGYQDGNWNVKADFAAALCKLALRSFAPSESAKPDSGTVKILTDLLDRAYKMHVMAGTATYLAAQDADQNDPLLAWLSDVRSVLYGKTKLEPRVPTSGERPEIGTSQK